MTAATLEREPNLVADTPTVVLGPEDLGFTRLPGGVRRKVRANRKWFYGTAGQKPWIVVESGKETQYASVEIAGPCRMASGELPADEFGCSDKFAHIVTTAELLVK